MIIFADWNDCLIIIKNEVIERNFISSNCEIIGMDFYHKGLHGKEVIGVFTYITKSLKCIPLCISIMKNNEMETIEKLLQKIKNHFKMNENTTIMMDNHPSQKGAAEKTKFNFILCKFHILKCIYCTIFPVFVIVIHVC